MNLLLKHRCLLLLPLHVNGNHWVLVCVDIANHKMIYYDSNPPADTEMADVLFKKLSKLIRRATPPHESTASTRPWEKTVLVDPRQANNYDCGLFVMEAMRAFVLGIPFTFSQKDMKRLRLVWLEKLMAHWNATKPKPRETDIKELEGKSLSCIKTLNVTHI